jgi:hypothetical protein
MTEATNLRLYLLRGTYLLIVVGLGSSIWPDLIHHAIAQDPSPRAGASLLAAVSAMALLGVRYPLQMLPLLLFELVWKSIWLIGVAYPLWATQQMTPDVWESVYACLMGWVIFPLVIPWPYVYANYVKKPGDKWK